MIWKSFLAQYAKDENGAYRENVVSDAQTSWVEILPLKKPVSRAGGISVDRDGKTGPSLDPPK